MQNNSGEREPQFEFQPVSAGQEAIAEQALEKPAYDEKVTGKQPPASAPQDAPPVAPVISIPVSTPPKSDGASASPTKDLSAGDSELIEKQWVERAKAIVAQTKNDPYNQKKEISKAGADYIKKRFNKSIPTDDAVRA